MKCDRLWQETIPRRDDIDALIHCVTFSPDGKTILVAAGRRVLVYGADDGILQHSLKGHKAEVYAIAYANDGNRFASGGAGRHVYVWTSKCEGLLKYGHDSSIQCLAYNPKDQSLASGTASDFGIWSPSQKNVSKYSLKSKCLCLAWTNDGLHLALGLFNGHVSIRDTRGVEKVLIQRTAPIWCMQWSPPSQRNGKDELDTLVVGCWDQTLSFYHLSGQQRGSERAIAYDPLGLKWYDNGQYILCGGSDRKVSLYTKTGQFLKVVCETNSWVSSIAASPTDKYFSVGRYEPLVSQHKTIFNTVHGLYQDRYAYRDTMTEVIIQHLITEQKVRIKVRDYVKKIAVYKDRLAIQLPGRILIYQCETDNADDMHYLLRTKIEQKFECNLLVVTAMHIILCHERKLQLFDFRGEKIREWSMDSVIRYIRVIGGPLGREGLLVGLKDGTAFKIFINNQFPILLVQHTKAIRCLDINASREKLAVVDEDSELAIYDIRRREIVFQDSPATSVAWNTEMTDSLCYSGRGQLSIKHGEFPVDRQPLQGFVVGFKGSKIFCLHHLTMRTVDVPQSHSLYLHIEQGDYERGYSVACLGVTREDWGHLAHTALKHMSLKVARKSFIRMRDYTYLQLLDRIETASLDPQYNTNIAMADIYAYQGRFKDSALLYMKAGQPKRATEMLFDVGEWDQAKVLVAELQRKHTVASNSMKSQCASESKSTQLAVEAAKRDAVSMSDLLARQAKHLLDRGQRVEAAEMYWTAKDVMQCIRVLGDGKHVEVLIGKVRAMNKSLRDELNLAAQYFVDNDHHAYAKETLLKLEDYQSLIDAYVKLQKWDDAFELARSRPELAQCIYEPYAEALALEDKFEEAEEAFVQAGKANRAMNLLRSLTSNAIAQHRYSDAAYYYWKLAVETLKSIDDNDRAMAIANGRVFDMRRPWTQPARTTIDDMHAVMKDDHVTADSEDDDDDVLKAIDRKLMRFRSLYAMSSVYYAYHYVYRFTDQPFTAVPTEHIFHGAHMVLNYMLEAYGSSGGFITTVHDTTETLGNTAIQLSTVRCLYAFAEIGQAKGVYKSVRAAYDLLRKRRVPDVWKDQLDVNSMRIRNKPFTDTKDLQSECFRCGAQTALLGHHGNCDECQQCGHEFIRSFATFEVLPLVEFFIDDIDENEAITLISRLPTTASSTAPTGNDNGGGGGGGREHFTETTQALHFEDDDDDPYIGGTLDTMDGGGGGGDHESTQFMQQLIREDISYPPITLNRLGLQQLHPREVFHRRWNRVCGGGGSGDDRKPLVRTQYYKCIIRDFPISQCHECQRFFHEDDFELHVLEKAACPVCRAPQHIEK